MVLSNTFRNFVSILLGPVAFLNSNVFIKGCTSLGSLERIAIEVRIFFYLFVLSIFLTTVIKNFLRLLHIANVSCLLTSTCLLNCLLTRQSMSFFLFFVDVYNRLDSISNFRQILRMISFSCS